MATSAASDGVSIVPRSAPPVGIADNLNGIPGDRDDVDVAGKARAVAAEDRRTLHQFEALHGFRQLPRATSEKALLPPIPIV